MPTSGSAAGYDARRLLGVGSFLRGAALSASGTGEPIAHGRDAEVYALGDGRVLRRYRRPGPTDHELRVMAHARSCGFPVPQVYERTETDLVMDYLDGPTMLADLTRRPWRLLRHAKTLAQLHRQLHAIPAPADLPAPLGEGTSLVHLDLHPGNVLLTASGPMVIDWPTQAAAAAWPTWPAPG